MVQHVDVELALLGEAREGEIAAAEVADDRVDRVGAEQQVELGVQGVAQEELDDELAGSKLGGQPPQAGLVLVGWRAQSELLAELLGEAPLEADSGLEVDAFDPRQEAQRLPQLILGQPLHPDEQPAAAALAARPAFDEAVDLPSSRAG